MAERKKIALCLEYPLALRGGVSVLVETLLLGLKEHYELILVSPDTPESLATSKVGPFISKHFSWDRGNVTTAAAKKLASELSSARVDLAHFHMGGNFGWGNRFPSRCPIPYLDKAGIPTCSTVHSVVHALDGFCGPQKPLWFKLAIFPFAWISKMRILSHLRCEIAVSQHDAAKLQRWYRPLRGKFVQMYHSRLKAESRSQPAPTRDSVILNVGHLAWRKGQGGLAEAFALVAPRHPAWKLLLVGQSLEQAALDGIRSTAKAHGLEDRIQLLGERPDAMDLMNHSGIYVQPSNQEALGLALQEAMFLGCPSIGTRVGGIPELIQHERNGLLVEPGNPARMAEALETLMSNPQLRERYGRAAADSIVQRGMTAEQMVANHFQLYESIFKGS